MPQSVIKLYMNFCYRASQLIFQRKLTDILVVLITRTRPLQGLVQLFYLTIQKQTKILLISKPQK